MGRSLKWAGLLLAGLLGCMTMAGWAGEASAAGKRELVFFNWSDYMDQALIRKFEKRYGVIVRQPFFESDDERTDTLVKTGAKGFDLAVVDTPSLHVYRKAGWLEPIDVASIPNYRHIDSRWLEAAGEEKAYTVPYFWGTLGIAYRKDLVKQPPDEWMDLFRPAPELQGRIGMYRNTVDLVGAALKALGYSVNDASVRHLDEVADLLRAQKPFVRSYDYLALDETSTLVSGEIVAGMFYNGDALAVREYEKNIEYVVPREGGVLWIDHLVVFRSSRNKELAWKFIDFLNEPENAAQLAQSLYFATPNKAAEALLPDRFKADPAIYPPPEVVARSELNHRLPARVVRKRARIVSQIVGPALSK